MAVSKPLVGLAIASGKTGVATVVTVIGFPVTMGLATASILTGVADGLLNAVVKSHQKNYLKAAELLAIAQKGRIDLQKLLAHASCPKLVSSLDKREIQLACDI